MTKIRILGILIIIIGIILNFLIQIDGFGIISGLIIGLGVGIVTYGLFGSKSKKWNSVRFTQQFYHLYNLK